MCVYVDGRERWYRCDTKSQAKALNGRVKAEQREGSISGKGSSLPRDCTGYLQLVDSRRASKRAQHRYLRSSQCIQLHLVCLVEMAQLNLSRRGFLFLKKLKRGGVPQQCLAFQRHSKVGQLPLPKEAHT